ncbi:ABC transporter substrate-binding protein [Cryobacterium luteum]|uniref:ABC transporter substrate-binding protein n=1 Tax=Cryobacterium luteum TaxID=1424661 RepID=A0A1H8JCD8_9MICO|nr:ABC transporter substrate-binding protein [Cryobacterium luteum]TFB92342.1 ABC transporter substrate-binding protein [Cryobacterium luteum]SEN78231.1 ABC-type nitrate/sulfonate/bicarbonate transport system, substrate-binding protein [Cryobacterium luteum]
MNRKPLTTLGTAILVALAAPLFTSGCSGSAAADTEITTIRYQGAPNTVSLIELAGELGYLGDLDLDWVSNTTSGPQSIQSVATDETDIGGAFSGAVVNLIEAGALVTAVINYYGEDEKTFTGYYVLEDSPIHTARDLIGKKIGVNTLGAHHEAVIRTYLQASGLSPNEIARVELVVVPPNDTELAVRRGQLDVGTLGGVLQDNALAVGGVRALFTDIGVVGGAFDAGQYVLRNDFIDANPATSKKLVTGIAQAIEWQRKTPVDEVIATFTKIIDERGRNENTSTLKYWKSVGIARTGGEITNQDFTRWAGWLKESGAVTTRLTPSDYYTNELNGLLDAGQE